MIQHIDELEKVLEKYHINPEEMVISSSSAMAARDICDNHDVDLVLPKEDRMRIIKEFHLKPLGTGTFDLSEFVQVCVGKYDKYGVADDDLLNDKSLLTYNGYRITPLELELCRIIDEDREKDAIRIKLIEDYIDSGKPFDYDLFKSYMDYRNQTRTFRERLVFWLKYNNPKRSGLASFVLALALKIRTHLLSNVRYFPAGDFKPRLTNMISPGDLLLAQENEDGNNRFDILVNYYSIKKYCEDGDNSFCLSQKKDISRTNTWQPERYTELIDGIKKYGYSNQYPILIDSHGNIIDGGHRLAAALYFGVDMVSVQIITKKKKIFYGENWFKDNGFTVEEINKVKEVAEKDCALKNGTCTVALAFGYSRKYWEEIRNDIEARREIIESGMLELGDELYSFLENIYSIDAMEKWKIQFKYNLLKKFDKSVMYVIFKTPVGEIREREDGISLNGEVVKIKARIRNKYAPKLGGYCDYSDTIIHMGDNSHSNKKIIKIIERYNK